MRIAGAQRDLSYCTNIHRGETWPQVREALDTRIPAVKRELAWTGPFGVGLRLSARAAHDLDDPAAFEELRAVLAAHDLYVFTLNGFPYGPFHGARVKEGVYAPDWRTPERLAYSERLARHLAALLEEGATGSVSTVPGAFKAEAVGEGDVAAIAENLLRHAAQLWRLRETTGRTIALALEPEPECLLETTAEAVAFIEDRLLAAPGRRRMAALTGLDEAGGEAAVRTHLGICLDVCHAAVEFEDLQHALRLPGAHGIRVPKAQLSAALRVPAVDAAAAHRLRAFDDGVYLHQVVAREGDRLVRYLDLPQALEAHAAGTAPTAEWRIHFHVPVFRAELDGLSSTQAELAAALDVLAGMPEVEHLEVETYTWDVLPARHRDLSVDAAIARELAWVRARLPA